ncbi:carbohydrate-binding domain-containing protein [Isoptericola sp. NPDC019693]|uniref:carbohydrate-binding domain-containing protein n=1 Tax=Isoptericola sp. NPDC019693 TaxID=3364009 RepID=UPI003793E964
MRIPRPQKLWTRAVALAAAGTLTVGALAACTAGTDGADGAATSDSTTTTQVSATDNSGRSAQDVLAENLSSEETAALADATWDTADEVAVSLDGDTASASGDGVTVDGSTVTITRPGTYRISGTLDDGQVVVDSSADGVVRLVLDAADVTSSTGAAIDVQDADQVSVVLADGSTNRLEDAAEYADTTSDNAANAALYSTADLAISGNGSLEVVGNANDGITGKDGLVIASGTITVQAADDAIRGKDYLVVSGGTIDVTAGGDGLKSDADDDATAGYVALTGGDVTVEAGSDGVQGFTDVAITGGTLTVTGSEEGIEAATIAVSGGDIDITSTDDGLNATVKEAEDDTATESSADATTGDATDTTTDGTADDQQAQPEPPADDEMPAGEPPADGEMPERPADGEMPQGGGGGGGAPMDQVMEGASITITDGTLHVDAEGDGLDSNGVAEISGGTIVVEGPTNGGNGALDVAGDLDVTGGTLLAVGSSGMAQAPSEGSSQGWVALTADSTLEAGTEVAVVDADGTQVATITLSKTAQSVVYSGPEITDGATYTLTADGEEVGTATAGEAPAGGMGGAPSGTRDEQGAQTDQSSSSTADTTTS